ncbi:hypothetical protein J1605_008226 [Eschrichtius robustus]|uniref:Uncharacterized protein n=1 Tax=Eschrichtius robustus TaxID=9764 RepID=A0AB34GYH5_ESCRO|nr:hypothetical protein J1605_008226 [Eschrichtius robustus]
MSCRDVPLSPSPSYVARAGIGLAAGTAVHPAVHTGMALPQDAGEAALAQDTGRRLTDYRAAVSSRLTRQEQPGSRSLDPFSPVTRLCSHPRCPSIGLALLSRAGQCGQRSQAEAQEHWLTRVHPC